MSQTNTVDTPLPKSLRLQQLAMPSRLIVVLVSMLLAAPPVIFWLWLVIWRARVAILCPEGCRCDPGGYFVVCDGTSFNSPPSIKLTDVRNYLFKENKIVFLEKDSFVSLTELETLHVIRCGLRTVQLGAFNGLKKLTFVAMYRNGISEIITSTFKDMISLEHLDLGYNRLEHVESAVFSGLVNLKYIDLEFNQIQYLHPHTFLGLPNLQFLYLHFNPIHIPTDSNFINSPSLSRLDISYCNVSSLSVETFANVSALEKLDLTHNKLKTVDINILRTLPKLSSLYLDGNPLQCDCQLEEVWRWCKDRNITTDNRIKYLITWEVGFKGLGVMETRECLEGNIHYNGNYKNTSYCYNDIGNYTRTETHTFSDMHPDDDYYEDLEYYIEELNLFQVKIYAVPFIFGTTGNVIILIIIICNKDMRTVPYMYIFNLALSDTIYLTVHFSEACENTKFDTWLDGDFRCQFIPFCRRLSVGLSAYSVVVLSIQRYRVIVNPFHVRVYSKPTWRGTFAVICGVWIVAALFAVPSALSKYSCKETINLSHINYYQSVVIFELLVSCVLPLCVIAFSYITASCHLVKTSHSISEGTQNPQLETRRNTAKIVVGLTFVFVISYVPYHVFWTYINWNKKRYAITSKDNGILDNSSYKEQNQYLISKSFLLINSCLNPVALFCTSSPFRQHLKRYLSCFCKTNSPSIDLELQRRN